MTDKEVQLFLADLAIIIILARLLGLAAKRLGQPPVLGEITAGILLGPTLFDGKITATLFPITLRPALSALANLGVVMFMFVVGYELDLRLLRGRERVAASVSVSSIILPLALGTGRRVKILICCPLPPAGPAPGRGEWRRRYIAVPGLASTTAGVLPPS
jgi:Kef-type K+ transport system membrane component KefB